MKQYSKIHNNHRGFTMIEMVVGPVCLGHRERRFGTILRQSGLKYPGLKKALGFEKKGVFYLLIT